MEQVVGKLSDILVPTGKRECALAVALIVLPGSGIAFAVFECVCPLPLSLTVQDFSNIHIPIGIGQGLGVRGQYRWQRPQQPECHEDCQAASIPPVMSVHTLLLL